MARIDALFDDLIAAGGSDLHLAIGYPPMMRLRGELTPMRDAPIDAAEMDGLLFDITSPDQKRTILETLDLDFAYGYGQKARFRANYLYKTTGLAAVFRTIPSKVLTLDDLHCPPSTEKSRFEVRNLENRTVRRHIRLLNFGSMRSRIPSLRRFKPSRAVEIVSPVMVRTQGARAKYSRPSAMMLPSEGLGGCTPRPRKLKPASMIMPKATPVAA